MKRATEILELKVFAIKNGTAHGDIQDLLIEPKSKRLAYVLSNKGHSLAGLRVLPFDKIYSVGIDFITTESEQAFISVKENFDEITAAISFLDLLGAEIMTVSGENAGKLRDLSIDEQTGVVETLHLDSGDFSAPLVESFSLGVIFIQSGKPTTPAVTQAEPAAEIQATAVPQKRPTEPQRDKHTFKQKKRHYTPEPEHAAAIPPEPAQTQQQYAPLDNAAGQFSTLIGKRSVKDITDADGSPLIKKGEVITAEIIQQAKAKNLMRKFL